MRAASICRALSVALLVLLGGFTQPPQRSAPAHTLLRCGGAETTPARQQIGPPGGNLELPNGHGLGIPPRSLPAARNFEMAELRGDSVGVRIGSGASQAIFRRFAILTVSYQRCPASVRPDSLVIVRIDAGGMLTPLPSYHDRQDRSVTAILSGNSEYALGVP